MRQPFYELFEYLRFLFTYKKSISKICLFIITDFLYLKSKFQ